ncbi:hypothetical protein [Vibrio harveyi]|uniref:hypothetical protein n=1 Tax=Vibrio harveyi TaxID=669 RepID=UPI0025AF9A21|nr:hypothetical protein [Vibrio harveyi]WJT11059.1 hypothetical protein PH545_28365 [Vibrio harveyi]
METNLHGKADLYNVRIVENQRGFVARTKKRQAYWFNALAVFLFNLDAFAIEQCFLVGSLMKRFKIGSLEFVAIARLKAHIAPWRDYDMGTTCWHNRKGCKTMHFD